MTKEELEKEAEDFTDSKKSFWRQGRTCIDSVKEAYIAGAEPREKRIEELEKKNAELRKIAEFQQFSNMGRHFENKKLKDTLAVGSTWNKHLNAQNNALEEERDKYRNMVFNKDTQLTRAKEIILKLYNAGRDVLMCRAEEKAYDKLSEAINDRSIERFLEE